MIQLVQQPPPLHCARPTAHNDEDNNEGPETHTCPERPSPRGCVFSTDTTNSIGPQQPPQPQPSFLLPPPPPLLPTRQHALSLPFFTLLIVIYVYLGTHYHHDGTNRTDASGMSC